MKPLVTSFVLVELFAVLTSAGGRLREGSLAGRAQLSRIALLLGLGLALVQGFSIAKYLAVVTPYVADPGPGFILIATLTLVAGTAGLWALGMALSRMGLGNGLGLIFVFGLLEPGARFLGATEEPFPAALIPGAAGVLLALFMARMERNDTEQGDPALPAFPQGVLPVAAVAFFLPWIRLLSFFSRRLSLRLAAPQLPSWTEAAMLLVLVPLLSWAAYLAVSGPRRLANDLPGLPEERARVTAMMRRRFPSPP